MKSKIRSVRIYLSATIQFPSALKNTLREAGRVHFTQLTFSMGGEGGEQFKDPTAVLSVTLSVSSAVCLSLAQMAMGAAVRRAR